MLYLVTDTLSTHGITIGPDDYFVSDNLMEAVGLYNMNPLMSA